jgi:hypothetical protein
VTSRRVDGQRWRRMRPSEEDSLLADKGGAIPKNHFGNVGVGQPRCEMATFQARSQRLAVTAATISAFFGIELGFDEVHSSDRFASQRPPVSSRPPERQSSALRSRRPGLPIGHIQRHIHRSFMLDSLSYTFGSGDLLHRESILCVGGRSELQASARQ